MNDKDAYDYLTTNRNTIIRILELRAGRIIDPKPSDLTRGMYHNGDSAELIAMINGAARFVCEKELPA